MITIYKATFEDFISESTKVVYVQMLWRKLGDNTCHELNLSGLNKESLVITLVVRSLDKSEIEVQKQKAIEHLKGLKKDIRNGAISDYAITGEPIK